MTPATANRPLLPIAALTALVALFLLAACTEEVLDESLTTLKIGDCITNPGKVDVEEVEVVNCDQPSALQVIGKFDVIGFGDEFPGPGTLSREAFENCPERTVTYMAPTQETWEGVGDRLVVCFEAAN